MPSHPLPLTQLRQHRVEGKIPINDQVKVVVRLYRVITPTGSESVEWRLRTNRPIETVEQAIELIEWYRARWEIDIYFHVIRNGCKVEELQLSSIKRIERTLVLFMVVARRVTYLMRMGRTCPDLDAALFFDPDEIRGVHLLAKKKIHATPPTLSEIVRLIALVGGFLGRKVMASLVSKRSDAV